MLFIVGMKTNRFVLVIHSSSELYGSSKIILQVLRAYRQEGLEPVILLTSTGPFKDLLEQESFIVYVRNLGILRRKYVTVSGLINRGVRILKAFRFLSGLHKKYRFSLVYSNTLAVVVGAIWAKTKGLPHCWHIHEIIPGKGPLVLFLSKLLDASTPFPIAVSHAVATTWQSRLHKSTLQVIHNAIPYQEYLQASPTLRQELGLKAEQVLIGMIGRINPGKGQLFFLSLAAGLCENYEHLHFVLVGDPFPGYEPILDQIHQKIEAEGLQSKVSYLGFREDIPEILASLDIFVLPSVLPDSFPTVILEAMAAGKPVLASRSGGASEMILPEETGYLYPIQGFDQAMGYLEKLIEQSEIRKSFGISARTRVLEAYSLEKFESSIRRHLWQHLEKS